MENLLKNKDTKLFHCGLSTRISVFLANKHSPNSNATQGFQSWETTQVVRPWKTSGSSKITCPSPVPRWLLASYQSVPNPPKKLHLWTRIPVQFRALLGKCRWDQFFRQTAVCWASSGKTREVLTTFWPRKSKVPLMQLAMLSTWKTGYQQVNRSL